MGFEIAELGNFEIAEWKMGSFETAELHIVGFEIVKFEI